ESFSNQVGYDITDPERKISVWRRPPFRLIERAPSQEQRDRLRGKTTWPIEALGSGSDYTAFLDFAGIASLNIAYGGEPGGGIYHSVYDDYYWYTHFDDPSFVYGRALAQTIGTAVMRMADAELLPFNFSDLFSTVRGYVSDLERLADNERTETVERNREIGEGVFTATADPTKPFVPPVAEAVPPHLNFAPLENALDSLNRSTEHYTRVTAKAQQSAGLTDAGSAMTKVNRELLHTERALTDPNGLPGRPWYKHQLYAPGFYTGYGVKTIPAVREAIEQLQWDVAQRSIESVAKVLDNEAGAVEQAATDLEHAAR